MTARLSPSTTGWPLLDDFAVAGMLGVADVHVASQLSRLTGEHRPAVVLAAALAVRAARSGSVSVDLAEADRWAPIDEEEPSGGLPGWPQLDLWLAELRSSPMVAEERYAGEPAAEKQDLDKRDAGEPAAEEHAADKRAAGERADEEHAADKRAAGEQDAEGRPLVLNGRTLYLDRFWRDEVATAAGILRRAGGRIHGAGAEGYPVERLLPEPSSAGQRRAVTVAASQPLTVITGGPGTGKTTTVATIVAVLLDQADKGADCPSPPVVALGAPTGKAAARLQEAVRSAATDLDIGAAARRRMESLEALTLHRLLGGGSDGSSFRHDSGHRLAADVVVIDEVSMVSLPMIRRLLYAVRPDASLVLVGDADQLLSVEAGAVLADIVGRRLPVGQRRGPLEACVVELTVNHRFSGALADLAAAVRAGDGDGVLDLLSGGVAELDWLQVPGDSGAARRAVEDRVGGWARELAARAGEGDGDGALATLRSHRLLCAHRRGGAGMEVWNQVVQAWSGAPAAASPWFAGRPVMVTTNDYSSRLFNGDTGICVALPDRPAAVAFEGGGPHGAARLLSPYRLPTVETVFATTVHKSQGSEFDRVTLVLPEPSSPLLTRELLYTGVTRARRSVTLVGTPESVKKAVSTPALRSSGLSHRLWGSGRLPAAEARR